MATQTATTQITATPHPGTAKGKITTSRFVPGLRILVNVDKNGRVGIAHRKTGAQVATVERMEAGGSRFYHIHTDLGLARATGNQTWFLAPEPKATERVVKAAGTTTERVVKAAAPAAEVEEAKAKLAKVVAETVKATEAKAPAKAAAAAKAPVPTSLKEMTREQKRAVAALLIRQAGALAAEWSTARQSNPELAGDLEGVSAKLAGELIGSWLSYCPGTVWHPALGDRPRGGK